MAISAYYKVRIQYKNPGWIDGESTTEDMEYFQTKDIVLNPPPNKKQMDAQQQHAAAQATIGLFWSGQAPLMVDGENTKELFIHPNRIISIEIVTNIEIAQLESTKKTVQAVASG